MKHSLPPADSVRGILKNTKPRNSKGPQLKWDEENLRITELQKDSKMKVDEPKTPFIHYDMEKDPALQDLEDLRLSPSNSSRASSVSFSAKKTQYSEDWESSEEEEEEEEEELDEDKAKKHSKFDEMRSKHYLNEGVFVHKNAKNFWGLKNGKFIINKEFSDDESSQENETGDISNDEILDIGTEDIINSDNFDDEKTSS